METYAVTWLGLDVVILFGSLVLLYDLHIQLFPPMVHSQNYQQQIILIMIKKLGLKKQHA